MQTFINNIYNFIISIYSSIDGILKNSSPTTYNNYQTWLEKPIISGDLITIGMNWYELLRFASLWILTIFFIIFFVNIVFKVVKLICIR